MKRRAIIVLVVATGAFHLLLAFARANEWIPQTVVIVLAIAVAWAVILGLAMVASKRIVGLQIDLRAQKDQHQSTLGQVQQLAALNEMLLTLGRSKDVGLAFQSLARHVGRLVPCDRLGLALLREGGHQVLTYSARVSEPERRRRPRPELEYSLDRSLFGHVIRTCEGMLVPDLSHQAGNFQDAQVLVGQGMQSALVLPLISRNRAIGALMVMSRERDALTSAHQDVMQPLTEVLAFAFVSQQQHHALEKYQTMESMSEMTLALASEINGALQGIIGEDAVLRRRHPQLAGELDPMARQTERIALLLERIRSAARERVGEPERTGAIPASPEAFGHQDEHFA